MTARKDQGRGWSLLGKHRVRAAPKERRRLFSIFVMGFCAVSLALFHVWGRLQVVRLGYVLSTASKLRHQLEEEHRELRLELASLTSPQRLEEMAAARLGMQEPAKNQVVILP